MPYSPLEGPVEAGVVLKAAQAADLVGPHSLRHEVPGDLQPLLLDIAAHAGAHLPLEFMAQVVFADEKRIRQQLQRQRLGEIQVDVVDDLGDGLAGAGDARQAAVLPQGQPVDGYQQLGQQALGQQVSAKGRLLGFQIQLLHQAPNPPLIRRLRAQLVTVAGAGGVQRVKQVAAA